MKEKKEKAKRTGIAEMPACLSTPNDEICKMAFNKALFKAIQQVKTPGGIMDENSRQAEGSSCIAGYLSVFDGTTCFCPMAVLAMGKQ